MAVPEYGNNLDYDRLLRSEAKVSLFEENKFNEEIKRRMIADIIKNIPIEVLEALFSIERESSFPKIKDEPELYSESSKYKEIVNDPNKVKITAKLRVNIKAIH